MLMLPWQGGVVRFQGPLPAQKPRTPSWAQTRAETSRIVTLAPTVVLGGKEQEQRKTTRKRGKHGVLPYRPRRRKLHLRLLQEPKAKTIDPARKWKGKFRILVPHPFAGRRQILI